MHFRLLQSGRFPGGSKFYSELNGIGAWGTSGLLDMDASGFERTLLLHSDLTWMVEVFGSSALDTVLRSQQVRPPLSCLFVSRAVHDRPCQVHLPFQQ